MSTKAKINALTIAALVLFATLIFALLQGAGARGREDTTPTPSPGSSVSSQPIYLDATSARTACFNSLAQDGTNLYFSVNACSQVEGRDMSGTVVAELTVAKFGVDALQLNPVPQK